MGIAMVRPAISKFESWASVAKGRINNSVIDGSARVKLSAAVLNSSVDAFSYVGTNVILQTAEVGRYCSIAPNVVCGGVQHDTRFACTSRFVFELSERETTIIHNDVWIGAGVQIIAGISLATGTIVGAGAVVTKSTEPFGIYVGNPARLMRFRYVPSVIDGLLESKYWLMTPTECKTHLEKFFLSQ